MKKLLIIGMLFFVIFMQFSCDDTKESPDVEFETELNKTLSVSVFSTDQMTASTVLDASKDPDILKYVNSIKKYEITDLKFAIANYSAPTEAEIYFNGDIGFSKTAVNMPSAVCSVSPLPVTHWAGTSAFAIKNCNNILGEIETVLTGENAVKIYLTGSFTNDPFTFELIVTAKVKVTANPG